RTDSEQRAKLQAPKLVVFVLDEGFPAEESGERVAVAQVLEEVVDEGLAVLDAPGGPPGKEDPVRSVQIEDVEHGGGLGHVGVSGGPEDGAGELCGEALVRLAGSGGLDVDDARSRHRGEEQGETGDPDPAQGAWSFPRLAKSPVAVHPASQMRAMAHPSEQAPRPPSREAPA